MPASAQSKTPTVSREVVQPLPSRESLQLDAALSKLARDPRNVAALVEAGDAARAMGDVEASVGFYRRASQIEPANANVKAGLAAALVLDGDPLTAIPLFEEAERSGGDFRKIAAERGLAYDLVGNNAKAQEYYRQALTRGDDPEVRRRLALSQAIAGDDKAAEQTLMPLLRQQDKAAWRARAFGLAILGNTKDAVRITDTMLPPRLAERIAPYMRYMPQLTRAQQAAAANLGRFPRAAEIGRDDPRMAALSGQSTGPARVAAVDAPLVPQGESLGKSAAQGKPAAQAPSQRQSASQRRANERKERARKAQARVAPPEPMPAREIAEESATTGTLAAPRSTPAPRATVPAATPAPAGAPSPSVSLPFSVPAATSERTASPAGAAANSIVLPQAKPASGAAMTGSAVTAPTATASALQSPAAAGANSAVSSGARSGSATEVAEPGFDLAALPAGTGGAGSSADILDRSVSGGSAGAPTTAPAEPAVSFGDMFSDLGKPVTQPAPIAGAVDLTKIKPAVPKPPPPKEPEEKPKPAPPSHPSRIWVQLGIGQSRSALRTDWGKMQKQTGDVLKGQSAYVSDLGRTNRMLTGPFESQKVANSFIAELKKAGMEGPYIWTSPAGQVVDVLAE